MVPLKSAITSTFLLLLSAASSSTSGPHIADLNILLPPRMSNPVQYRLQGSDGCFSWSWDHHDLLAVKPEYNGSNRCSTSTMLTSIAPYTSRQETAVYATDLLTGTVIRCKVLIDKISRIKIFHHAVKIDLDELATLHIRAFDDEENVFSSLVGLRLSWKLIPKPLEAYRVHHLIHVPLKETPLTDCASGFCGDLDIRIEQEDIGIGSDLFVVKGIGIGHEIVSAKLLEPQLEHVEDEIILTIAEAMSIDPPSPVFVTVGTLIYYSLRVIHRNVPEVIELPSPHHRWSVLNSSVARVDSMVGTVHALHLGITSIIVEDTRVSGHMQASTLHVVCPEKLSLYLLPVTDTFDPVEGIDPVPSSFPWFVFPGQKYIIMMKVFSEGPDTNEILITENTDLKLEDNISEFWDLLLVPTEPVAKYGWRNSRLLVPYSLGEGVLTASLFYHSESKEEDEVLTVVQQVIVCGKVMFSIRHKVESLDVIQVPWAPGVYQEVQLMATGGCGKTSETYAWQSSDEAVLSVCASGFVQAKRPGRAMVKVASSSDSFNYDVIAVEVSVPSSMVVLPIYPVEVEIGTQLKAAVTFKTSNGNYYYQCDAFNSFVRWNVFSESETFRAVNLTAKICETNMAAPTESSRKFYVQPCAWTCLYVSGAGRAMLHATLSTDLHSPMPSVATPFVLHSSFPIAAYAPLVAYQAGNGNKFGGYYVDLLKTNAEIPHSHSTVLDNLYLVPGSSMEVLLYGGPKRWDPLVEYLDILEVIDDQGLETTGVQVQQAFSAGRRGYRVVCLASGNFKLLFSRGNLVGGDHPLPAIAKLELCVICSFPSSITLVANEPENALDVIEIAAKADRDSSHVRSSPITVANCGTIRIAAIGLHKTKNVFTNSSSLCLRWELLGCEDLAYWSDNGSFKRSVENNWERFLVLENSSGLCTVRASVSGLSETIHLFEKELLQLESLKSTLVDGLRLQLVSSLRVMPESVLLVFDPEAKVNLSVSGGTCFLDAFTNDTQVAVLSHPSESAKCSHLILSPRGIGTALVTIRDIGLSPPAAASAMVKVANVEWIKIVSEEEMSLMEGTTRVFELITGTEDGYIFDSSQYAFMNIRIHHEDGILELVDKNDSSSIGLAGRMFSVRAVAVGITTIYVSLRQRSGHEKFSQIVTIEVYKPLQVYPDYIYLTPGASYVLITKGGPTTEGFIEYASMHEETAIVQASSGKLSAISIGNTTFHATVYGKGGNLICEAYGRVEVGIPQRMILSSQSEQLCIGCKMPIFPSFPRGSLFSFYEICNSYQWVVENEEVLQLESAGSLKFDDDRMGLLFNSNESDLGFINTLFGRSAGKTEVSVSYSCDFISSGTTQTVHYTASKALTVIRDPPLALGMPVTWIFPTFYTTSDVLPSLTESYGLLDVPERRKGIIYSVLTACEGNEFSKKDTITIHGNKIRTKDRNDLACIQAKDQSTLRTEIASCVRVAEVAQVRISFPESSFHSAYLAVNAIVELTVNYCDGLGYTFAEANGVVPLDIDINYPHVLSIQNPDERNRTSDKVLLKASAPGRALVRISINHNPNNADFILVSVGAQLYPQNPVLNVGSFLNFSVIGDGIASLPPGQWFCNNGSVLSINRISGEARASAEGRTQVFFQGSNFKLQTMVNVMKADQIIVDAPSGTLTNSPFPSQGYKFPVRFSTHESGRLGDLIEVPFDCRVDPPFLGYAKPWIDHGIGNLYCLFIPHSPKHLQSVFSRSKALQSDEVNNSNAGFLYVSIIVSLKEAPRIMGAAHALFVGGFSIGIKQLNLTHKFNQSRISLTGNTDLDIYWNAKDLLLVSLIRKEGSGIKGFVEYDVKVLKDQSFRDKLTFVLPATGQKAEIDVSYERETTPAPEGSSSITWSAVILCAIVLILTIIIFTNLLDRPSRTSGRSVVTSMTAGPTSSTITRLSTPEPASAPANVQSTPRTPQPFVEYVRRTIDETPYYRRSGRRRVDPQHTY